MCISIINRFVDLLNGCPEHYHLYLKHNLIQCASVIIINCVPNIFNLATEMIIEMIIML